jgi:hypothetical protein
MEFFANAEARAPVTVARDLAGTRSVFVPHHEFERLLELCHFFSRQTWTARALHIRPNTGEDTPKRKERLAVQICFPGNFSAELKGELLNGNRSQPNFRGLRGLLNLPDFWKRGSRVCTIAQHSAEGYRQSVFGEKLFCFLVAHRDGVGGKAGRTCILLLKQLPIKCAIEAESGISIGWATADHIQIAIVVGECSLQRQAA